MPKHSFSRSQLIVIGLICFSFLMSALVSERVFERLPHLEDEVAYLYQAKVFARGNLVLETPQPRRSFWQPFVVDFNGNRFSKYTPGWSAWLAVGVVLGQTWVINAFFASLTIALVYRLGAALFNREVGVVASALTAFSPMALLLNASLMGHTMALFFTTLFIFAYWKIERTRTLQWGILAGFALGMVVIARPLTAIGIALPFIAWSGWRLIHTLKNHALEFTSVLKPLVALAIVTILITSAIPIYNHATAGDAGKNLYTLVWSYDSIGFGECCGRNGHTIERGIRHARFDLSWTANDALGWSLGTITPEVEEHILTKSDYFKIVGVSFILLPFGVIIGVLIESLPLRSGGRFRGGINSQKIKKNIRQNPSKRLAFLITWTVLAVGWCILSVKLPDNLQQSIPFSWAWVGLAFAIVLSPLLLMSRSAWQHARWTWLLFSVVLCLVIVQLTYWIGSQRYSTRYYFEALTAFTILSAIPIVWLAQRLNRWVIYAGLSVLLIWSLYAYSTPRISALYRFNFIGQHILDGVEERREGDSDVLVIVTGPSSGDDAVRWRSLGTLMVATSPYFDSPIVGAWDYGGDGVRQQLEASFPNRQIIEMRATGNTVWFVDEAE